MKWQFPAKTFLLGEYAALCGQSAVILTTGPCFVVEKIQQPVLEGIHPESPAGQYWLKTSRYQYGLRWHDPFQGMGGLGASSAQFLGAWLAHHQSQAGDSILESMLLDDYWTFAWNGQGKKPSGYDLRAQLASGCVFINQHYQLTQSTDWNFKDLNFLLVHTGNKLATHTYLQKSDFSDEYLSDLSVYAEQGFQAIKTSNSQALAEAINKAQQSLGNKGLVSEHSQVLIESLQKLSSIKAIKGCGAMGADVLALLISPENVGEVMIQLHSRHLKIIASDQNLYRKTPLFTKFTEKTLEILTE